MEEEPNPTSHIIYQSKKPCSKCGGLDFYFSGSCVVCTRSRAAIASIKRKGSTGTYTGRPCKRCQRTIRYVNGHACVVCLKEKRHYRYHVLGIKSKSLSAAKKGLRGTYHVKKQCSKCGSLERYRAGGGCPSCARTARRNWRFRLYGLTKEKYESMWQQQQGRCAICEEDKPLSIDHNHTTHKVRDLLCRTCNAGLGQFKDRAALLEKARNYLIQHQL